MSSTSVHTLADGRRMSFALYGSPHRVRTVIYVHGFPGSRREGSLFDSAARARGITIIAPNRPGFGSSDPQAHRTLLGWADDIRALCAALSIERTAMIGVSGGGPYALACAHTLPPVVSSLQVVSTLAPPDAPHVFTGMARGNRLMFGMMRSAPHVAQLMTRALASAWASSPELCLAWFRAFVPHADRRLLRRPEIHNLMIDNIRTAFEHGSRGPADDFSIIARPWGFALADISVPTTVWHGLADTYVPPAMGAYVARMIPGAPYRTFPDSGHLLLMERIEEILDAAVSPDSRQ